MNILFHGSASDVYIHWLILSLGLGVFISGFAVLTSCRIFAGTFIGSDSQNSASMKFYRAYRRYHPYYWVIFWLVIVLHLMATIYHLRLPIAGEPYLFAHRIVIFTALANIFFILVVLSSCGSFANFLGFFTNRSPLANNAYRRFYKYHSYSWWALGISLSLHITFGMVHSINT
jgi:cytochrome b561